MGLQYIRKLASIHFRNTTLILHDDEVWLKIGGDKGSDTFKFWVTPLVHARPDQHTLCTLLYKGEETRPNLEATLTK